MLSRHNAVWMGMLMVLFLSSALHAQTANGTINATLVNKS